MHRLRHPIRSITEPYGKAGLTVAILALVMAMVGGAYAAGGLTKSQEKQVVKIAKKYAGKPGAPGAAGANGTNGTAGKEGPQGKEGIQGIQGIQGKEGKQGKEGPEGSPWPAGGTLPPEQTEKGTWAVVMGAPSPLNLSENFTMGEAPISFTIPLKNALDEEHIKLERDGFPASNRSSCEEKTEPEKKECEEALQKEEERCPGTFADPKAGEGYLCLYTGHDGTHAFATFPWTLSPAGAVMQWISQKEIENPPGSENMETTAGTTAVGDWAVTASE